MLFPLHQSPCVWPFITFPSSLCSSFILVSSRLCCFSSNRTLIAASCPPLFHSAPYAFSTFSCFTLLCMCFLFLFLLPHRISPMFCPLFSPWCFKHSLSCSLPVLPSPWDLRRQAECRCRPWRWLTGEEEEEEEGERKLPSPLRSVLLFSLSRERWVYFGDDFCKFAISGTYTCSCSQSISVGVCVCVCVCWPGPVCVWVPEMMS